MEVVVTTGAISRAKLQTNYQHQQTNIQFFLQAGCPSCRPTNSVKALKGKYHIPWTCLTQGHLGVFQLCLWPLIAPGYLGGGLPCLPSALWRQYPPLKKYITKCLPFLIVAFGAVMLLVVWVRASCLWKTECWYVGADEPAGALQFQLSLPPFCHLSNFFLQLNPGWFDVLVPA